MLITPPNMQPLPTFKWGSRTYIMGIINATPDSFSGDGVMQHEDAVAVAVKQAQDFLFEGADILDIGAESTRPGSRPIPISEEKKRLLPVLKAIREAVHLTISVDTYRAEVAQAALEIGANWVNDVWGLRMDADMARVVAEAQCPVVLMHNRSQPKNVAQARQLGGRYVGIHYDNLLEEVKRELMDSVAIAVNAGVREDNIILDPGIGFGKTVSQNLELLNRLDEIKELGYPVLLGTSRKSFIGYTLDLPPEERAEGTAATVAIGIERGADVIRVHDVKRMAQVAKMTDSVVRNRY